jgi:hypothetical protein
MLPKCLRKTWASVFSLKRAVVHLIKTLIINIVLLYLIDCTAQIFYIENDAEIFPGHYTWKVAEKGFKMAFMMNKLEMVNSGEIILKKQKKNLPKIIVKFRCALYLYAHYT